uniref:G/T mismatch-specific thymine DNA glycosylase isoform X3 n=1 Tax=Myxine glutinosa TaxID=7769 RepID=UPI00358E87B1
MDAGDEANTNWVNIKKIKLEDFTYQPFLPVNPHGHYAELKPIVKQEDVSSDAEYFAQPRQAGQIANAHPVPPCAGDAPFINGNKGRKRAASAKPKEPRKPKAPKAPKLPKVEKPPKSQKKAKGTKEGQEKSKPGRKPGGKQEKITDSFQKVKRKINRFKDVTEEELLTKTLPDILDYDLNVVIIGINPGLMAAYKGHHYPGPGNHFWKCLFLSGMTDSQLSHVDDQSLPEKYSIGFTNIVGRTTPGCKDLKSKEIREGGKILLQKLKKYRPKVAVFNGKCIFEIFSKEVFGEKIKNFQFGEQPKRIPETEVVCYVMPSSSARCAQFPRAQDKVHFYIKLKELSLKLHGKMTTGEVQETDYTFDLEKAQDDAKKVAIKEEKYDPEYEVAYGGCYTAISNTCSSSSPAARVSVVVAPPTHVNFMSNGEHSTV